MRGQAVDYDTEAVDPLLLRAEARIGRVLRDKWRLDAVLGIGGMAAVYAATHRNGKRGAIKLLHPELSVDAAVRSRFLREGYVANKVGHPGAVAVLDDDVAEDGSVFLVMELLEGEPVDARAQRLGGRLGADEVLSIADQVLETLVAAHEQGIVHRDLKPQNLFVTLDGQVKILDFGIARLRDASASSAVTRSGTSMGTPAFMAPEQARGLVGEIDARTDLWAVGATMFALLSGRLVHEGRTANEVLVNVITRAAPALASAAPDVPSAVHEVVDRALAYERGDRWASARAMQHAVRLAYERLNAAPISTAPKLRVPELPSAKTLASAEGLPGEARGAAAQTGTPVAAGMTGIARVRTQWSSHPGIAVGVAVGLLAVATLVVAIVRHAASAAPDAQAAAASAAAPPRETASGAPATIVTDPRVAPAPSVSAAPVDEALAVVEGAGMKSERPAPAHPAAVAPKPHRATATAAPPPPTPASTIDPWEKRR